MGDIRVGSCGCICVVQFLEKREHDTQLTWRRHAFDVTYVQAGGSSFSSFGWLTYSEKANSKPVNDLNVTFCLAHFRQGTLLRSSPVWVEGAALGARGRDPSNGSSLSAAVSFLTRGLALRRFGFGFGSGNSYCRSFSGGARRTTNCGMLILAGRPHESPGPRVGGVRLAQ